jgi:hypothetical protein
MDMVMMLCQLNDNKHQKHVEKKQKQGFMRCEIGSRMMGPGTFLCCGGYCVEENTYQNQAKEVALEDVVFIKEKEKVNVDFKKNVLIRLWYNKRGGIVFDVPGVKEACFEFRIKTDKTPRYLFEPCLEMLQRLKYVNNKVKLSKDDYFPAVYRGGTKEEGSFWFIEERCLVFEKSEQERVAIKGEFYQVLPKIVVSDTTSIKSIMDSFFNRLCIVLQFDI